MATLIPPDIGALTRYEDLIRDEARLVVARAPSGSVLREEDLCAEGRFAVLEAVMRLRGWGLGESDWVVVRIRARMAQLAAGVAHCEASFDLS